MVHPKKSKAEMFVDVGLYGPPKALDYQAKITTRKVEEFVRNVHGWVKYFTTLNGFVYEKRSS